MLDAAGLPACFLPAACQWDLQPRSLSAGLWLLARGIPPVLAWIAAYRSKAPTGCQATDVCSCCLPYRDQSFTAVRTAGLTGETTSSSPTSPRVKPPGGGAFGGNTNSPLLKAALNANLARINAVQQQQALSASGAAVSKAGGAGPGSLHSATGMMSASGALTGGAGGGSSEQPGISSNVKQRLKEYFVARNTELLPAGAAGGHGAGAGFASSDTGYSGGRQQPSPMQH